MISEKLIKRICSFYKLKVKEIFPAQSGYRNKVIPILSKENEKFNLIFYKSEPDILQKIKSANSVGKYLYENNFLTRYPIKEIVKIKSQASEKVFLVCLYNYLFGETIPWEAYTSKHIKLLGGEMGKMHKALEIYSNETLSDAIEELKVLKYRMQTYFEIKEVKGTMQNKLEIILNVDWNSFDSLIRKLNTLPKQALHMDFVRGNILFSQGLKVKNQLKISGVLDFEKTSLGPKILDIGRTLAFLIIDCKYKSEEKVRKYFLLNGYEKRGENKVENIELLEELLNFYWLYDFYKFLKHNPYEDLKDNEHFVRTKKKLLVGKCVSKQIKN